MVVTMIRAWVVGFGILLCTYGLWTISLQTSKFSETLFLFICMAPGVAAFVSAYIAPHKKVLLGTSMAVPSAVLAVALKSLYELLGNAVDFPGFRGGLILFVATLVYSVILCAFGGVAGYFVTKKAGGA